MSIPSPNLAELGLTIARLRAQRGYSIDTVAELSGIHRRSIIQIEAGRVAPRISTLHSLAHALDVPLGELASALCVEHPPQAIGA